MDKIANHEHLKQSNIQHYLVPIWENPIKVVIRELSEIYGCEADKKKFVILQALTLLNFPKWKVGQTENYVRYFFLSSMKTKLRTKTLMLSRFLNLKFRSKNSELLKKHYNVKYIKFFTMLQPFVTLILDVLGGNHYPKNCS